MPTCRIDIHDLAAVEDLRRELKLDPYHLRRFFTQWLKNRRGEAAALAEIPAAAREAFARRVRLSSLRLEQRHDSAVDGASKLLLATHDDLRIETVVLRVQSGRTALCISSQVGCGVGCSFCATGRLGARRNLTPAEILDQVIVANSMLEPEGRRVRNIVFMGMGEPLHNEQGLHGALDTLLHKHRFDHAPGHVCVSTVGIPAAMVAFARRHPKVRMALSLHAARDDVRRRLIPLAEHHDLQSLRTATAEVIAVQDAPVMLEYLLLDGVNDGEADLEALVDWIGAMDVHVNLIPYNVVPGVAELSATPRARREDFGRELKRRGLTVTLRYSLGADVAAACGQLVRDENRRTGRGGPRDR